jgi:hypothetical protein
MLDHSDSATRCRLAAGFAALRVSLGAFLLVWAVMKFAVPDGTVGIFASYYGVTIDARVSMVLGALQGVLALAVVIGLWRTVTVAAGFCVHAVGQLASWRETLDPWGIWLLSQPRMLFWAGVPVLAGFALAWLGRDLDIWSVDARRTAKEN